MKIYKRELKNIKNLRSHRKKSVKIFFLNEINQKQLDSIGK